MAGYEGTYEVYYLVTSVKPYTLQRVLLGNSLDHMDVPTGYINRLTIEEVKAKVNEVKAFNKHMARASTPQIRENDNFKFSGVGELKAV